ncbi:hypothetical protein [Ruegeria sp. HKCCD6428]|uniref:hypothetical protein n=1 Tax=Ruegeria sp. HKCCD6428 TaxID=2683002 RepID=UPI0014920316|nr:hypothetical protein [Ruegeria sp. HKCCD6428]NOC83336.1 hypothetical protein [Ruegeria sp. HKCCD6428]
MISERAPKLRRLVEVTIDQIESLTERAAWLRERAEIVERDARATFGMPLTVSRVFADGMRYLRKGLAQASVLLGYLFEKVALRDNFSTPKLPTDATFCEGRSSMGFDRCL